jgi:hypothetical protein
MAEGRLLTDRNCAPTVRFVTSRTLRWVAHVDRMVCNKPTSNCVGTFRKDDSSIFEKPNRWNHNMEEGFIENGYNNVSFLITDFGTR